MVGFLECYFVSQIYDGDDIKNKKKQNYNSYIFSLGLSNISGKVKLIACEYDLAHFFFVHVKYHIYE